MKIQLNVAVTEFFMKTPTIITVMKRDAPIEQHHIYYGHMYQMTKTAIETVLEKRERHFRSNLIEQAKYYWPQMDKTKPKNYVSIPVYVTWSGFEQQFWPIFFLPILFVIHAEILKPAVN